MRAVRLVEARRLEPVEVPDPAPGPGEAVVRVVACGICGSDLSCYKAGVFVGSVLGHEFSGTVEAVGADAGAWRHGDPVVVDPKIPCGRCPTCLAGDGDRCAAALGQGLGGKRDGGYAELVRAPVGCLHPVPAALRLEDACLTEPLSVALHGLERAGFRPGEGALVIGLGPIGLLTVAALRARGAGTIVGVDPVEARRVLALTFGADRALPPGEEARAAGRGMPIVVESSGRPDMIQEAANLAAPGGRVLLQGIAMTDATVVPMVWVTRELSLVGSVGSSRREFEEAADVLAREPSLAAIVTRRVPLESLPQAFEDLLAPTSDAKVAVDPRL